MRDFVFVHLHLYLRVFAIWATLYFYPMLDHFNKVTDCIPSFALFALSAIIFYGLRKYLDYDRISKDPWGELHWQEAVNWRTRSRPARPEFLRSAARQSAAN